LLYFAPVLHAGHGHLRAASATLIFGSKGRHMSNRAYLRVKPNGFWRRLIAFVVVHAVAVQALLVALGGLSLAGNAAQNAPTFELCLHDTDGGAPQSPAQVPDYFPCTHCILCVAGAHAVVGTAPVVFCRINIVVAVVHQLDDTCALRRLTRYAIASPRGPPFDA
jgi:hypothetical protein